MKVVVSRVHAHHRLDRDRVSLDMPTSRVSDRSHLEELVEADAPSHEVGYARVIRESAGKSRRPIDEPM